MSPALRRIWVLVFVLVSGSATVVAAEGEPLFAFEQTELDNGLKVISLEDFSCPVVNVQLWYHVGSKDEQVERQGFAHMFEHMMFRGTDLLGPTDHFDFVRRTGGSCNAYTSFDQTVYHETLPAAQLELALWLEAQRMSFLKIDQNAFDTERKVVEEERRMGLNRPYGSVFEQVMGELFDVHPYQWTPIGKIPHLRASSVAELRNFWTQYYVPNNATLVVAGAVKHGEVQQLAKRHFGWIPAGDVPDPVTTQEPPEDGGTEITIQEDNAPVPLAAMVYRTVSLSSPDRIPLELMAQILVGDNSSRMYRDLVVKQRLAVQTLNIFNALEQDGVYIVGAVLSPASADMEKTMAALQSQLRDAGEKPVTERELTKARNQMLRQTIVQTLRVEGKAAQLGQAAVLQGNPNEVNKTIEQIRAVTVDDLQRVARKYLAPEVGYALKVHRTSGSTQSRHASEDDAPITAEPETNPPAPGRPGVRRAADYRTQAPIANVQPAESQPEYSEHKLSNGLRVVVLPNHEVPFVSVQLGLLSGAWAEEKPGTASMALDMLTQGTEAHSEAELADLLGTYAIDLGGSAGMDSSSVVTSCLTEQLPRAMELLTEVVTVPTFPQAEFERKRRETQTNLAQAEAQPDYVAGRELRRRLYGQHPYARTSTGESSDLDALSPDDLREWWATFARPDTAVLYAAGDVDAESFVQLAEKTLSAWKAEGNPVQPLPSAIPKPGETQIIIIDRKTSTQSQIAVGQLGIARNDDEYATARVVNGYFGGAFNSRLNDTIRVQKGLTYGARGGFSTQRFAGQFSVTTFTKTATTAETVQAIFGELDRLLAEPPSEKEIGDTKSYILGSFAIERETPQSVASDLWTIELNGLPADEFQRQLQAVAATSPSSCTELVREAVDPERMVVVVVGNAAAIRESLEEIAPVTVIESKDVAQTDRRRR